MIPNEKIPARSEDSWMVFLVGDQAHKLSETVIFAATLALANTPRLAAQTPVIALVQRRLFLVLHTPLNREPNT
jgi:hypothetical protein